MNLVIVANDINLAIALPAGLLKVIQQFAEKGVVFLRPQDLMGLPSRRIERRRQIALLILACGPNFKLRAFEPGAIPDVAGGFQLKSNGLARDFNLCQRDESRGQGGV
jgi:hypothetical protein